MHFCVESKVSEARVLRGKELRDGYLNFHRRDSEYLLWFELEPQTTPLGTTNLARYIPGSLKAGAERRAWYTLSAHASNYAHDSLAL